MTKSPALARRLAAVASAAVAISLLAVATPAPAAPTAETGTVAQAAKAKVTKAKTAKTRDRKTTSTARAAATVASATDFTSIFAGQQPSLANAGWTSCSAPISWTVDTSALGSEQAARQIENLKASFAQWSTASGLTFSFAGTTDLRFNEAAFTLTRTDGAATAARTISLAFIDDAASDLLGGGTVGMAGPTTVWSTSKEIESGTGIFRTDAVKKMSDAQAQALFTHELGHVLGLGHADEAGNIMYPVVGATSTLGAGDVAGVQTMTKPCAA